MKLVKTTNEQLTERIIWCAGQVTTARKKEPRKYQIIKALLNNELRTPGTNALDAATNLMVRFGNDPLLHVWLIGTACHIMNEQLISESNKKQKPCKRNAATANANGPIKTKSINYRSVAPADGGPASPSIRILK